MKCLSIRQPWAWLIVNGHKDIENRSWSTRMRGQILIHASKGMTRAEYDDVADFLTWERMEIDLPNFNDIERGGIVGSAQIIDCVTASRSKWFFGEYGFLMKDAQPLAFTPFKGALGFFDAPAAINKSASQEKPE